MKLLSLTTLYVASGAAYVVRRDSINWGTIDSVCNFTTLSVGKDIGPILGSECAGNDAANRIAEVNLDE